MKKSLKELSKKQIATIRRNLLEKIKGNLDYQDFNEIVRNYKLPEDFIREFSEHLDWFLVSYNQVLSEDFILENKNIVDWDVICYKQKLSEDFVRKNIDLISWEDLCTQELSFSFIRDFQDKVC